MERSEAATVLEDLKTQFEILDDLANMDWMIFTYEAEPPWFYFVAGELEELTWFNPENRPIAPYQLERKAEHDKDVHALRARLIDAIAALDLAVRTLAE